MPRAWTPSPSRAFHAVSSRAPPPCCRYRPSCVCAVRTHPQWSNTAATFAEPAAGWTKAVVAAAVLVAGGAGVAGHSDRPATVVPRAPIVAPAPASDARGEAGRAEHRRHAAAPVAPASVRRAAERSGTRAAQPQRRAPRAAAEGKAPTARVEERLVPAPSAEDLPQSRSSLPSLRTESPQAPPAPSQPRESTDPTVNPPAPSEAVTQVEGAVTKIDGNAGQTVSSVGNALGLGG